MYHPSHPNPYRSTSMPFFPELYAKPVIPCSIRRRVTANVREIKAASKSLGSICGGMERKSRYEVDRLLPESTTD
ncbi:hypothetical protein TNCT_217401 [Trichonephila clavata]|uniref:Uncharacterized protein n=1 Tax=Trichonephila clavata TaxID=2740835 RepID=A0A8X6G8U3_TRICU|nr:hypothetical protein TNCT_217401 [Trichonephila clavata]